MRILITAATEFESLALRKIWPEGNYSSAVSITYLTTGVGPISTAALLSEYLCTQQPDLILNIGLAGALDLSLELAEVVHVVGEEFGDLGVEQRDGTFTSIFELGLADANAAPFTHGRLQLPSTPAFAKTVQGVTVSTVHGSEASIATFRERCPAQVESMEGAAAMWVAMRHKISFIQLRAISNYVEPRNRESWVIEPALDNLTTHVDQLLSSLPGALEARSARRKLGL